MQGIMTVAVPATAQRGACVRARCTAHSMLVPWDHALGGMGSDQATQHKAAAKALVAWLVSRHGAKLWGGVWIGGSLHNGDYCWVRVAALGSPAVLGVVDNELCFTA